MIWCVKMESKFAACSTAVTLGTHFDYNHHIVFISTHTKIGTHKEGTAKTEVNLLIRLFERSGYFSQCLSPLVSKLSARDKNQKFRQGLLVEHIQELAKTFHEFVGSKCLTLVGGGLRWP